MNKKKIIIIIVAVLLIGIVLYFVFFKKNKPVDASNLSNSPLTPTPRPTSTETDSFPLGVGSKGKNVVYLQNALNKINKTYSIPADGSFGTQTKSFIFLTVGTIYYPVTQSNFTEILTKANNII